MKFQLKEARRNRVNVTYHVYDEDSICGSINVKPEDSAALLKHWSNASNEASASAQNKHLSAQQSLAAAFMANRRPFSKAAILRS